MTAYEMVDGEYYLQGSDEYYAALQEKIEAVDVSFLIARELNKKHYPIVPGILVRAAPERSE